MKPSCRSECKEQNQPISITWRKSTLFYPFKASWLIRNSMVIPNMFYFQTRLLGWRHISMAKSLFSMCVVQGFISRQKQEMSQKELLPPPTQKKGNKKTLQVGTQHLRIFATLTEDSSLIPRPTWQLTTVSISSSGNLAPSSGLCRHQVCIQYINIHARKIHINKKDLQVNVFFHFQD